MKLKLNRGAPAYRSGYPPFIQNWQDGGYSQKLNIQWVSTTYQPHIQKLAIYLVCHVEKKCGRNLNVLNEVVAGQNVNFSSLSITFGAGRKST